MSRKKGFKHSEYTKEKMSKTQISLKDSNKYSTRHKWVNKHFEKPNICEKCDFIPGIGKDGRTKIHWANISGKYERDRRDWLALCISCHQKMDKPWLKWPSKKRITKDILIERILSYFKVYKKLPTTTDFAYKKEGINKLGSLMSYYEMFGNWDKTIEAVKDKLT